MFTLMARDLPSARGFGESVRMMADIGADENIVRAFVLDMSARYLLVGRHGNGFIVMGDGCLAQTRTGKQVMNTDDKNPALMCVPVTGDTIAMSGSNDKLLIFQTAEIPTMARGKGVILDGQACIPGPHGSGWIPTQWKVWKIKTGVPCGGGCFYFVSYLFRRPLPNIKCLSATMCQNTVMAQ